MADIASQSLCRELYELSGWSDLPAEQWHGYEAGTYDLPVRVGSTPAYDLGYLLRKLPEGTQLRRNKAEPRKRSNWRGEWVVGIYGHNYRGVYGAADTPEDAAVKLAVELFKQNILRKED